nr:hypothetical protein [uncultured Prevotella sp.]
MSKKIIAVNAGPRKGWNTDTLIMEAAKGKTDWPWTMFDPESKKLRHETVFPQHQKQVILPVWLAIPVIGLLTFLCCAVTTKLISLIPGSKYIIG